MILTHKDEDDGMTSPSLPLLLLYDDRCNYCTRFAFLVYRLAKMGDGMMLIGLNSIEGYRIKSLLYEHCNDPDGMFWLLYFNPDCIKAYGGRAALFRLVIELIKSAFGIVRRGKEGNVGMYYTNNNKVCIMNDAESNAHLCIASNRCNLISRLISLLVKGENVTIAYEQK